MNQLIHIVLRHIKILLSMLRQDFRVLIYSISFATLPWGEKNIYSIKVSLHFGHNLFVFLEKFALPFVSHPYNFSEYSF